MFIILIVGFASGLPLGLTGGTLQAWMKTENIDLATIGLFSLVGLPYTLKFLWSPLMDRYVPPMFGRRRGWMFLTQAGLIVTIIALGFSDPKMTPQYVAFFAVCVASFQLAKILLSTLIELKFYTKMSSPEQVFISWATE